MASFASSRMLRILVCLSRAAGSCPVLIPNGYCNLGGRLMSTMSMSFNSAGGQSEPRLSIPSSSCTNSNLPPSTISSSSLPWLMLPPASDKENRDMLYKFYSLSHNKVVSFNKRSGGEEEESESPDDEAICVGSSHGWLALFNGSNCDLFLSNPISGRHIKLPPIHTLPHHPKQNLRAGYGCVSKVIISSTPDAEEEEECRAIMIYAPESRLAFCCPGRSTQWTPLLGKRAFSYRELAFSSSWERLICVTDKDEFETWDLRSPSPRMIPMDTSSSIERWPTSIVDWDREFKMDILANGELCSYDYTSLVFAGGQLFHVRRFIMHRMGPDGYPVEQKNFYEDEQRKYDEDEDEDEDWDESVPYKTIRFDVHKYDREKRVWRYMDRSLDGLAFFIGQNHGFALSAKHHQHHFLKPNSIYFTDALEPFPIDCYSDRSYGGHDLGIYDYETRAFSSCYYPCDVQSIQRIQPAPMWFTPTTPL